MAEEKYVEVGELLPDFTLQDQDGKPFALSSLKGQKVVLFFYPKDGTPGCTKEACSLRDGFSQIRAKGAVPVGVSPDKPQDHVKFRENFSLPFTLLSDPEHRVMESLGAFGDKVLYGRPTRGVRRITYLLDEEGRVMKLFKKVKTDSHGEEVLAHL